MTNFAEFKELVKKKGYGSSLYNNINGETVYLSRGIREIFLENEEMQQLMQKAVSSFQEGEFGTAQAYGKEERAGHEYGRYDVAGFEACEEDTAVWVHRTENAIKVYFKFER